MSVLGVRLTCPECGSPDTKRLDVSWRRCRKCCTSYTSDDAGPDVEPLVQEARLAVLQPLLDAVREAGYVAVEIEAPVNFGPNCKIRWLTMVRGIRASGTDPRGPDGWPAIWGIARAASGYDGGTAAGHQIQVATNALPPGRYALTGGEHDDAHKTTAGRVEDVVDRTDLGGG